jgi:hypothetical protein
MTYDAQDGYIVAWGGAFGAYDNYSTWTFTGGAWTEVSGICSTNTCPMYTSTRYSYGSSMVYNALDKYVLFLGADRSTWKFLAGTWSEFSITRGASTCPSTRRYS